jgi:hypothetical protein
MLKTAVSKAGNSCYVPLYGLTYSVLVITPKIAVGDTRSGQDNPPKRVVESFMVYNNYQKEVFRGGDEAERSKGKRKVRIRFPK